METSDIAACVGGGSRLALTSKCYEPDRAHAKRITVTFYARTLFWHDLDTELKSLLIMFRL